MVARIKPGKSLRKSFYYNESKVDLGLAQLIHVENYPLPQDQLNQDSRLKMLLKLAALKPNVKVNSIHISLNYDPSEVISQEKHVAIARDYMERIGFGNQPFLIYQHFDSAHPHTHILTTCVESELSSINLHHIGIHKSEPARKELEIIYGLIKAEDKISSSHKLKPLDVSRAIYGKRETKRMLSNILEILTNSYHYTSIHELNALLQLYNVRADRGNEGSRIHTHEGLLYRILDGNGKPIGVPIKASNFHFTPTLKRLQYHFAESETLRMPHKRRLKNAIDLYFIRNKSPSIDDFTKALSQAGIAVVPRKNDRGQIYGLTYVDHSTKCVFNGSALDKRYSAKGILDRINPSHVPPEIPQSNAEVREDSAVQPGTVQAAMQPFQAIPVSPIAFPTELLEQIMGSEASSGYMPYELSGRKKKKKRKKK